MLSKDLINFGEHGVQTILHTNSLDSNIEFEYREDIEPILSSNNEQCINESKFTPCGDLHHVATIPNTVYMQWLDEGVFEDEKKLRRKLNDYNFFKLKTTNRQV